MVGGGFSRPDVIGVAFALIGRIQTGRQDRIIDCLFIVAILGVLDGRLEPYRKFVGSIGLIFK